MSVEPLRAVRAHLSEVVIRVEAARAHHHHPERPARRAAGQSRDLAQLEKTLSVLADPEALADIREADATYARGDVVRGLEAVRRPRR